MTEPRTDLLDAAVAYATAGLEVLPCDPATKAPLLKHGNKDATADLPTVKTWWSQRPEALVAARVPPDVVVLDIDPRHGGDALWRALRRVFDPSGTIATRAHYSGRGDGGGHVWFTRPPDVALSTQKLVSWAAGQGFAEEKLDAEGNHRGWTVGIDLLQHHHRYTILPPSPHPDTGAPYTWRGDGLAVAAQPLPGWLLELLVDDAPATSSPVAKPEHPVFNGHAPAAGDSIVDWWEATTAPSWADLLGRHGWTLHRGDGDGDGTLLRHPTATAKYSASIERGQLFVHSPNTLFDETVPGSPHGYTKFHAWAVLEHRGDRSVAASAARALKTGSNGAVPLDELVDLDSFAAGDRPPPRPPAPPANLPDDFWSARPVLEHVRAAAHNRSASPDAVLGAVLARVAAYSSHQYEIPPIVGSPGSVNLYVAVIAPSGTGKTIATDISGELLRPDLLLDVADDAPLGSGEGLAELFMGEVEVDVEGGKGKKRTERQQVRHNAFVTADEGAALSAMMDRQGATVLEALRRGWSGSTIGQSNASKDRRRIVQKGLYRLGLVVAFQPELAGRLLADAVAGTPQRFLFLSALDPAIPDDVPPWPGEIAVPKIPVRELESHGVAGAKGLRRIRFGVHDDIAETVRTQHRAKARGEVQVDELDSHEPMHHLKVAAMFALLDGRLDIDLEDWRLAGVIWSTSCAVRSGVGAAVAADEAHRAATADHRAARRELHIEDAKGAKALARASRSVANKVLRHHAGEEHFELGSESAGCTKQCINRAIASRDKVVVSPDDVLLEAIAKGWVMERDGRFHPGESRPG